MVVKRAEQNRNSRSKNEIFTQVWNSLEGRVFCQVFQEKFWMWNFFFITCKAFCFRYVGGDGIKDVDEHKKNSDQKRHASRDDLRGHQKTNPWDNNKHSRGKVVSDDVMWDFSSQSQLKTSHGIIT